MRSRAVAVAIVGWIGVAAAEPGPQGYAALPGGQHAPSAETLPAGEFGASVIGGYGRRAKLLTAEHTFTRSVGELAFAYAPTGAFTLALSFDGRYDKHRGGGNPGGDDGYVGDPHLVGRFVRDLAAVRVGAQLGVWVPGKDAPSVALAATTVDLRALAETRLGVLRVSANAGFRFDRSAKSIGDADLAQLSVEDRVSLGVSDHHAVVAGLHATAPLGATAFVGLEASADIFVGDGSPEPILRAGGAAGVRLGGTWQLYGFIEAARVPAVEAGMAVPLVPYEPAIAGGIGFAARFGGHTRATPAPPRDLTPRADVEVYALVTGTVVDDANRPAPGAAVSIATASARVDVVSDQRGAFTARLKLAPGDATATITTTLDGKQPRTVTVTLAKGDNAVPPLVLDPVLPPGQLRAVVRTAAGRPIANATVHVEPGGHTATTDADGNVSIDLAPGSYKVTASAPKLRDQSLDLVIEKDGVVVKNFELRR